MSNVEESGNKFTEEKPVTESKHAASPKLNVSERVKVTELALLTSSSFGSPEN